MATMMKVLDSPLDALAFDYVTFGFFTLVNNLWTWVAVLAAVSFWRIKLRPASSAPPPLKSDPAPVVNEERGESQPQPPPSALTDESASAAVPVGDGGVTKGKFTLYYDNRGDSDGEVSKGGGWTACEDDGGERREWWEETMKMRMGESGWYRFQDRLVLNGSVVRLWDGGRRQPEVRSPVSGGVLW